MGTLQDDRRFLEFAKQSLTVNGAGFLSLKLLFRDQDPLLSNNREPVKCRSIGTLCQMKKDPEMLRECLSPTGKLINTGKVEVVEENELTPLPGKAWWIPCCAVRHKKKGKIRMVFDSSAYYMGTSLNNKQVQGPDQGNKLSGVLARFRKENIGFSCDIEVMFHMFYVTQGGPGLHAVFFLIQEQRPKQAHRRVPCFDSYFWEQTKSREVTFALRAPCEGENVSERAKQFITSNFYVDDGLGSANTIDEAAETLIKARGILQQFNIRLHKIASSDTSLLKSFPSSEIADGTTYVDFDFSSMQSTLGVYWDLLRDEFMVQSNILDRPFTKRGILGVVNPPYNGIVFVSPEILGGRLLQRQIIPSRDSLPDDLKPLGWDNPLPKHFRRDWDKWKQSLNHLYLTKVPSPLRDKPLPCDSIRELFVFADSSQNVIEVLACIKSSKGGRISMSFLRGESKVAPRQAKSIPRLEICAALRALQLLTEILLDLRDDFKNIYVYPTALLFSDIFEIGGKDFRNIIVHWVF
ncbi:uncharacterized protein LOC131886611 [Tigriopus californicus]|uniref:uncharacterized protein LOC131886611 n=1 Tax=Tigriopus californicus TaxID=6832 RepID=UPI0027D9E34C|nr:uncharacterized protein LOC131886611 [Tigriopus californicus]